MKLRYTMRHIICTSALLIAGCQTELSKLDSYKPSTDNTTVEQTKPDLKMLPNPEKKSSIDNKVFREIILLDQNEIAIAHQGEKKANDPKVRAFAKHIATQHTINLKKTLDLSQQMNIQPEDSQRSRQMKQQSAKELKQLKIVQPNHFDIVFMNDMIHDHRQALSVLNDSLRKVSNPMLKAHIMAMYQIIEDHLRRAEQFK
jgi:predicted outer membrane protein